MDLALIETEVYISTINQCSNMWVLFSIFVHQFFECFVCYKDIIIKDVIVDHFWVLVKNIQKGSTFKYSWGKRIVNAVKNRSLIYRNGIKIVKLKRPFSFFNFDILKFIVFIFLTKPICREVLPLLRRTFQTVCIRSITRNHSLLNVILKVVYPFLARLRIELNCQGEANRQGKWEDESQHVGGSTHRLVCYANSYIKQHITFLRFSWWC